MDKNILKGNYDLPETLEQDAKKSEEKGSNVLQEEFEAEALKKLGGSITFVQLSGGKLLVGSKKKTKEESNG